MNKFYVEEGNKRVSVMKYFGADSIPGVVTRILPKRTNERKIKSIMSFLIFIRYPVSIISGSRRKEALRHCLRCLEKSRMKYGIMRQS